MKKNLLNAALLGLLIATPACSFVSCKDYDDDFNKVNNRLDNIDQARATVNTEITNLKAALETAKTSAAGIESKLGTYATKDEHNAAVENLNKKIADIAGLTTRVAALEAAKTTLEAADKANADEIAALKASLTALGSGAAKFLTTANLDDIATLPEKVKNSEAALATYKADIEKRIKDLEGKATTGTTTGGTTTATVDLKPLTDRVEALEAYKAELAKLKAGDYQTKEQVDAAINKAVEALKNANGSSSLNLLQTGAVTSIGFRPYDFVDGIETLLPTIYKYDVWSVEEADANGVATLQDFHENGGKELWNGNGKSDAEKYSSRGEYTGERGSGVLHADSTNAVIYAEAEYDFNPSNAKVNLDAKNFTFSFLNSTLRFTRATESPLLKVTKAEQLANGVVRVAYTSDYKNELLNTENAVMASLSYAETDDASKSTRVVQSDYKRVLFRQFEDFMIGKVYNEREAFAPVVAYLASPAYYSADDVTPQRKNLVFEIPNTGEAVKLAEQVATYAPEKALYNGFGETSFDITRVDQSAASESQLKRAGFHYEYALVRENAKDKSTDAFEINTKTGELKAKYDAKAPFRNVGTAATVRVTLISPKGEIAAVGYFTAKVAAKVQVITLKSDDALKYACAGDIDGIQFNLKALNDSLSKLYNYEVNVFNENDQHAFHFETAVHNGPITQQYDVKNGVATELETTTSDLEVNYGKANATFPFGVVTLNNLLRSNAKINKVGDSYETYVKLVKNVDGDKHFFYVRLLWTPKSIQEAPTVEFKAERKSQTWFVNSGFDNIRVHADIVKNPNGIGAAADYLHQKIAKDLYAVFVPATANNPFVTPVDQKAYPGFTTESHFKFIEPRVKTAVGYSGNVYALSVSEDGTKFLATIATKADYKYSKSQYADPILEGKGEGESEVIATITEHKNPDGTVKDAIIEYLDGSIAKDILNKYSKSQLDDNQTITGRVAYQTFDACGNVVKTIGNNEFDVKFVRPLNVAEEIQVKTFTDAKLLTQTTGVIDLHMNGAFNTLLTDYRDYKQGASTDKNQENLYKTYAVKVILAPKGQWLTNFAGPKDTDFRTFDAIKATDNFDLVIGNMNPQTIDGVSTYAIDSDHWQASFTYTSKTANVKVFTIYIPGIVTYKWGEQATLFKFVIDPSINQASSRRK